MDLQAIENVVRKYQDVIHTQNEEDFRSLWANNEYCTMISIRDQYVGIDSIYHDFLIGKIQKAYSDIELIADSIEIHPINEELVIVAFAYHTVCIRRETGEPYGIEGLETQVIVLEDGQWKLLHVHYSK